jgi:hypothetical protein
MRNTTNVLERMALALPPTLAQATGGVRPDVENVPQFVSAVIILLSALQHIRILQDTEPP